MMRHAWISSLMRSTMAGLLFLAAGSAFGAVLWSASPPSADLANSIQSDGVSPPAFSQLLPGGAGAATISSITWWGSYLDSNSDPVADASPVPYADDFVVSFNGGSVVVTGGSFSKSIDAITGGGNLLTRYELSGLSLALASLPTSLDIINNFNDGNGSNQADAMWFWQGIDPPLRGPASRAYIIEGVRATAEVPTPGILALFSLGLAAFGFARKRKSV